ncbi:MAG: ABC transporter ATP-binding protein [Miltoncostaeaceae bacterium]
MSDAPALRARGLSLSFPGLDGPERVLDGVGLSVEPGEVVALIGPSGCGKSTLLSALAGLRPPDAGTVALEPEPPRGLPGAVTLMPQGDALLPWRTLAANVEVGARLSGLDGAAATKAVEDVLPAYGLDAHAEHYPHALSGGQRQRASLARTVLSRRRVWLLDEPFGALDALTRTELQRVFTAVWEEHRPTVLLVTHDLDEALLLASRVLVSGPRPARVVAEVAVDLPRPRTLALTATPAFARLRGRLLDALSAAGAVR